MDINAQSGGVRHSFTQLFSTFIRLDYHSLVWLLLCGLFLCELSVAATPELANQELLRQQERERHLREWQEQEPDVRLPASTGPEETARLPEDESPCFPISHIKLTGELSGHFQFALEPVIQDDAPVLGKCLGIKGINTVLTRVQNSIIDRGYVTTRVLVAPQDIKSGDLILTVIPGRIHKLRFSPVSNTRGTHWNALPLNEGDLLNLRDIEQGLENFKRVPTAEVDIQIVPASGDNVQPGESDLIINYQQATPLRFTLTADDSGSKSTGKTLGSITLSIDNPLTLNDLFYANFGNDLGGGQTGEHGTDSYTLHYSLPYGYWQLELTTNGYRYHQTIVGINQSYLYRGKSRGSEIKLSRIFYRDASRKTTVSVRGYVKTSNNFIDDTEIEVQRRRMAGWETALTHREFMGYATLDLKVAYRRGTGAMNAMPAPEEAFDEGTTRPKIITAESSYNLPFKLAGQALRYRGTWRAQWNQTPLIAQDRFAIGGRYTIRGFDGENTLSAECGWLLRNDVGLAVGGSGQEFYFGLDYGHVSGSSADLLAGTHLSGTALGLRGGFKGLQYDIFVNKPISQPDEFNDGKSVGFNLVYQY